MAKPAITPDEMIVATEVNNQVALLLGARDLEILRLRAENKLLKSKAAKAEKPAAGAKAK